MLGYTSWRARPPCARPWDAMRPDNRGSKQKTVNRVTFWLFLAAAGVGVWEAASRYGQNRMNQFVVVARSQWERKTQASATV